ncbi:MAG: MoxR family ATPase [Phototrophicales bacterium]|nr:MAG: AAA family ATPase [Phototrophicales bacterium]RMG73200.1 MAG: MoxR family ATPase [Chloroflexota bacterium]
MDIEKFSAIAQQIETEVARVIVGQREVVRDVLICILAGRHALLEGVPGLGKTQLIRTLADVLDLHFSRIQFTPDLMPSDITGTNVMEETEDGRKVFRFQQGPIFANLILADEINRATPKTQSALLEAMQEKTVTVAGTMYPMAQPFFVLATQNPVEQEGTYPLPEAQLDRFMFKINVDFPTVDELVEIIARTTGVDNPTASKVATGEQVIAMRELALQTPVASHVNRYVAELIVASQPDNPAAPDMVKRFVQYGASPRGAQALILGAKINALLEGRFNVAFEDIEAIAKPALRHRLLLNFEGLAEGIQTDDVVANLLDVVQRVPA